MVWARGTVATFAVCVPYVLPQIYRPFFQALNMQSIRFTRRTIVAASEVILANMDAVGLELLMLRIGLEDRVLFLPDTSMGGMIATLTKLVIDNQELEVPIDNPESCLSEAWVREALNLVGSDLQGTDVIKSRLLRSVELDGFSFDFALADVRIGDVVHTPKSLKFTSLVDEVNKTLQKFTLSDSLRNLSSAISSSVNGDWEASDKATHAFLEKFFEEISERMCGPLAASAETASNRRALLAQKSFLSLTHNEWSPDGKGFVDALLAMLAADSRFPQVSEMDRSIFKLQVAVITSRLFLRRLHYHPAALNFR